MTDWPLSELFQNQSFSLNKASGSAVKDFDRPKTDLKIVMKLQQIVTNRFDYVIRYNWAGCGENCWVLVRKVKVHGNVCF